MSGIGNVINKYTPIGWAGKALGFKPGDLLERDLERSPIADPGPRPDYQVSETLLDNQNTGLIRNPNLRLQYGPSIAQNLDKRGIEAFRERALAQPGTSAWERMMTDKQKLEEQRLGQQALESGAARAAEARGALARKGGLRAGSSERVGRASMRDILSAQQDVAQRGATGRADIGVQAEQQRLAALGQLPGMELQLLDPQFKERGMEMGAQEFNIRAALEQRQRDIAEKMAKYQEQMRAYAATQQANAIAQSGPQKGGLLGGLLG